MGEIRLTGLKSGIPIGFMAALGAFRHATQMPELGEVKLRWTPYAGQWCAALVTTANVDDGGLVRLFVERVKSMTERPEFAWSDQIKRTSITDFRRNAIEMDDADQWFAAFGTELSPAKDGTMRSTAFDMTGGQQSFLLKLRQASAFLRTFPDAALELFREALFGPWQYRSSKRPAEIENSHSLGLDPTTLLEGAFTGAKKPADMQDKRGIRGAIWLAFEALPFFPCVYDSGQWTVSFEKGADYSEYFHWSIWESPISLNVVKTLLMHSSSELRDGRGVVAQFQSRRVNLIKDYYSLSAAELI